ncbi:sigma 54-interacting transcriptional regulator [Agarilytica rhodophyticola]|uniref:sigma 54-interacting transcriptional regulator n=1 Tax=Agarilytica rhodophyticola TaxID=1737490 RepID=UPI000B342616|nr:sigma-54 dependent transcriptional regulator [Agarilytica rhodophyticola]
MTVKNETTLAIQVSPQENLPRDHGYFLSIVFHPEFGRIGERANISSQLQSHGLCLNRNEPLFFNPKAPNIGNPLLDPHISRTPLHIKFGTLNDIAIVSQDKHELVINGAKTREAKIKIADLKGGIVIEIARRIVLLLHRDVEVKTSPDSMNIIGASAAIEEVRNTIKKISGVDIPVLIRGESGTGKELVAKAIHTLSSRKNANFISVNMAALPESLASSTLFGSKKGAFTGAQQEQKGYFRQADKGTLFLDEIGDTPISIQTLLLRTLENNEIQPVGASQPEYVNTRIISATDANLEDKLQDATFRTPLLQRLASYEIYLSPLRERREDIGPIAAHFLKQFILEFNDEIDIENIASEHWKTLFSRLCRYDWPGNIRQLKHILQQIVLYNRGENYFRLPEHIDNLLPQETLCKNTSNKHPTLDKKQKPKDISDRDLELALQDNLWDLKATADALNLSRSSLYNRLDQHPNLKRAKDISNEDIATAYKESNGDLYTMSQTLKISVHALRRRVSELSLTIK